MLIVVESLLAIGAVVLSLFMPQLAANRLKQAEELLQRVARRKVLTVCLVGLLACGARASILPLVPVPQPKIDDEYSHLLLADTLLHGRLANPTHPMWVHFETLEVNMIPTYASVYPPAQGAFLAAGKKLLGSPFFGVMLSVAGMCAAICWMLQGWMPPAWALLGGLFAIFRFGMFAYWSDSYLGGAP